MAVASVAAMIARIQLGGRWSMSPPDGWLNVRIVCVSDRRRRSPGRRSAWGWDDGTRAGAEPPRATDVATSGSRAVRAVVTGPPRGLAGGCRPEGLLECPQPERRVGIAVRCGAGACHVS